MPIMTVYKPFDVVLVPFPFSDLATTKKRPALVLSAGQSGNSGQFCICSMITSQMHAKVDGDVIIQKWRKAGLIHPSKLRLAKTATLEESLMIKRLGRFSLLDQKTAKKAFRGLFKGWL